MCTAYEIGTNASRQEAPQLADLIAALAKLPPRLIRRTDSAPVVTGDLGLKEMRWGFRRPWSNAINNARADKLATPMWSDAFQHRRCLIPAAAFYEWSGPDRHKRTHRFTRPGGAMRQTVRCPGPRLRMGSGRTCRIRRRRQGGQERERGGSDRVSKVTPDSFSTRQKATRSRIVLNRQIQPSPASPRRRSDENSVEIELEPPEKRSNWGRPSMFGLPAPAHLMTPTRFVHGPHHHF